MTAFKNHKTLLGSLAACAVLLLAAPLAHADATGDTATCAVAYNPAGGDFNCYPSTSTVGPGTTFQVGASPAPTDIYIDVDLFAGGMTLKFTQDANLTYTILNLQDTTTPWMNYELLSQTGMAGFNGSKLSLANGILTVDLEGTSNKAGDGFTLAFDTTPEPSSLVLLGTGMLGMLEMVRRRQRA